MGGKFVDDAGEDHFGGIVPLVQRLIDAAEQQLMLAGILQDL